MERDQHLVCETCGAEVSLKLPTTENLDLVLNARIVHKNKETHRVIVSFGEGAR